MTEDAKVDRDRMVRLEKVFHRARELASDARLKFLNQACQDDRQLRNEVDELLEHFENDSGCLGDALFNVNRLATDDTSTEILDGDQIGSYVITARIGEGGFGKVYLATRSADFRQQVAIKILRDDWTDSEVVFQRFAVERQILSDLYHENIARLLDGGSTQHGRPYFVMEYVDGVPITDFCDAHQLNIANRLEMFMRVCGAVAHAHQFGFIHRDIKPTNILVTNDGIPKLIDFGIAKLIDTPHDSKTLDLTRTGLLPFTPEYASPEQVRGEPVGQTGDVYSLGVVLYELLAGRRPYSFRTRAPGEIERVVCHDLPALPSTVVGRDAASTTMKDARSTSNVDFKSTSQYRLVEPERLNKRLLNGDLDNITLMALRKEPARRYQTAQQFSEDIANHIASRPVAARRDSMGYVIGKYLKRNRMAVLAATMASITLAALLVAGYSARRRSLQLFENRRASYASDMNIAYQSWEWGNLERVLALLEKQVPQNGETDLRRFEWYYLAHLCQQNAANTLVSGVGATALRPGSNMLVAVRDNERLTLVDFSDPKEPELTDLHAPSIPGRIQDITFAPDGIHLAIGYELENKSGSVCVMDLSTGTVATIKCESPALHVCFSADGVHGAFAGTNGVVGIWETNTQKMIWKHKGHNEKRCEDVTFSPDGQLLATVSKYDGSVTIWNVPDGEQKQTINNLGGLLRGVVFSHQGDLLVAGTTVLHLLDRNQGWSSRAHPLSNLDAVYFAFSPDGGKLAIASERGVVEVRDFTTGELLGKRLHIIKKYHGIRRCAFSHDGCQIVSGSAEAIGIWDLETQVASLSTAGLCLGWNDSPAIDSNSSKIALAIRENHVALWDAENDTLKTVGQHNGKVRALTLSTGGGLLAAASESLIRVWDTSNGELRNEFQSERTVALAFSSDNSQLISGGTVQAEELWNLSNGELTWSGPATFIVSAFFTSDGRLVTAGGNWGDRGDLRIWDFRQMPPRIITEFHCSNHISTATLSPDGNFVAAGNFGGEVVIYDLETLQHKTDLIGHGGTVTTLAFSPDGKTLVSGGGDGMLVFWNVDNWKQVGTTRHQRHIDAVRFLRPTHEQQGILVFQGDPEFNVSLDWVGMRPTMFTE